MPPQPFYTAVPTASGMARYPVIIEQDEDGFYVGTVPGLPGCHSQGDTVDDLIANMREAIALYVEVEGEQKVNFVGVQHIDV